METTHYISSDLLSIDMINEIVFQGKQLALSEEAIVNIEKCRKYLDDKMQSNSTQFTELIRVLDRYVM